MDYTTVSKKMEQLKSTGKYNEKQLEVINYAMFRPDLDTSLLLDPSIGSEYMSMYISLLTKKIPVEHYIEQNFHQLGFNPKQLYSIITAYHNGIDLTALSKDTTPDEIDKIHSDKLDEQKINDAYRASAIPIEDLSKLKEMNLPIPVQRFILRMGEDYDINFLINQNLTGMSLDQVKYIWNVYSTGEKNIQQIINPDLSVEQMKEIMSHSKQSIDFLKEIVEIHENRKK